MALARRAGRARGCLDRPGPSLPCSPNRTGMWSNAAQQAPAPGAPDSCRKGSRRLVVRNQRQGHPMAASCVRSIRAHETAAGLGKDGAGSGRTVPGTGTCGHHFRAAGRPGPDLADSILTVIRLPRIFGCLAPASVCAGSGRCRSTAERAHTIEVSPCQANRPRCGLRDSY